jgi:hypothetical protein
VSRPLKIFRERCLFERHPSAVVWQCLAPAWYFLPSLFFLEYGDRDSETWAQAYYVWAFSTPVFWTLAVITATRYFMIVMSPVLLYALFSFAAEVQIFVLQLDPNGWDVVLIKRELLTQGATCSIFLLILLEMFPWESLRLQTGP